MERSQRHWGTLKTPQRHFRTSLPPKKRLLDPNTPVQLDRPTSPWTSSKKNISIGHNIIEQNRK